MTTFNISSRPRSSHSTVLHIKANPKERSVKKADNEKRILAAAQSHFPGEVVEITTNPDDQSFGIFVGAEREHCYRAHETPTDRKSTRLNSSHYCAYRMPPSACKKKKQT